MGNRRNENTTISKVTIKYNHISKVNTKPEKNAPDSQSNFNRFLSPKQNVKGVNIYLDEDDFKPTKKITPMHLKLYESTQQNVKIIQII